MKILIAADGSSYTKRMLAYLAAHDEWLGDRHTYTVLNVVPAIPARPASVMDRDTLKGYYDETSEAVFKPIRAFFRKQGIVAEFVAKVGHAPEVIAKYATAKDYDLLMMGSHGHGTLGNLMLGSVATKVLAGCSTPVLLVR